MLRTHDDVTQEAEHARYGRETRQEDGLAETGEHTSCQVVFGVTVGWNVVLLVFGDHVDAVVVGHGNEENRKNDGNNIDFPSQEGNHAHGDQDGHHYHKEGQQDAAKLLEADEQEKQHDEDADRHETSQVALNVPADGSPDIGQAADDRFFLARVVANEFFDLRNNIDIGNIGFQDGDDGGYREVSRDHTPVDDVVGFYLLPELFSLLIVPGDAFNGRIDDHGAFLALDAFQLE